MTTVLVGASGGDVGAADYRVSSSLGRMLTTLIGPVAGLIFPDLSRLSAQRNMKEIRRVMVSSTLACGGVALLATALAFPLMPTLLELLFGPAYRDQAAASRLFMVAYAIRQMAPWSKVYALAIGRPRIRVLALALESVALSVAAWFLGDGRLVDLAAASCLISLAVVASWMVFGFSTTRRHRAPC